MVDKLAGDLLNPESGDVLLLVQDKIGMIRELYAWEWAISPYEHFGGGIVQDNQELNSLAHNENQSSPVFATPKRVRHRRILRFDTLKPDDIDFVTLHNILYYIYTGAVNLVLTDALSEPCVQPIGFPEKADAFDLYRNAAKFGLSSLKERSYRYLGVTTTPNNVVQRLLHRDCCSNLRLITLFLDYVVMNNVKMQGIAIGEVKHGGPGENEQYRQYRAAMNEILGREYGPDEDGNSVFFETLRKLRYGPDDWVFEDLSRSDIWMEFF